METTRWVRIKDLFNDALELPDGDRADFLAAACHGDTELRRETESLLDAYTRAGALLSHPGGVAALQPGDLLNQRFRIVRRVGQGGLGEVYEATDLQIGERVALKTLHAGFAGNESHRQRLVREMQLARRVTHPHVCRVFDIATATLPGAPRELFFLTMEFLEGETVAERLRREGALPLPDALRWGRQIAAGLDEAHRLGILHRDLKAANVMLTADRAVITDFGLARSVDPSSNTQTPSGQIMGTLGYMAPEQLQGGEVGPAADRYSFAVLMHEMLTGAKPAVGAAVQSPAHRDVWHRALAVDPAARFESATALIESLQPPAKVPPLRAIAAAVLIAILLFAALWMWAPWRAPVPSAHQRLAVLPFNDPSNSGLDFSLASQLADLASRSPQRMLVYPMNEITANRVTSPAQAQRALGATLALAGQVVRQGDEIVVEASLFDAGSLRQRRAFRRKTDLAGAGSELALLAQEILVSLDATALATGPPRRDVAPAAFSYYSQGLYYLRRDLDSADYAIPLLKKAAELDPQSALPWAALGEAYLTKFASTKQAAFLTDAGQAADQSHRLDPKLIDAQLVKGRILRAQGHLEEAYTQYQAILALDPQNQPATLRLGMLLDAMHRETEAEAAFQRAIELQPNHWTAYLSLGNFYAVRERYANAEQQYRRMIELFPDLADGYTALGYVYYTTGRYAEAETAFRRSVTLKPTSAAYANLGALYQRQKKIPESIAAIEKEIELGGAQTDALLRLADTYLAGGDRTRSAATFRRVAAAAETHLTTSPRDAAIRASLAYALAQVGEHSRALFEIRQALQIGPVTVGIRREAVIVHELAGDRTTALALLEKSGRAALIELQQISELAALCADPRYQQRLHHSKD